MRAFIRVYSKGASFVTPTPRREKRSASARREEHSASATTLPGRVEAYKHKWNGVKALEELVD